MTPNDIVVLISYYLGEKDLVYNDSVRYLLTVGLLKQSDKLKEPYEITSRGRAHVCNLCSICLPEKAWIDQNGEIIDAKKDN